MYNFNMARVILKKMRLAGKNSMIKYRNDWPDPEIVHDNQVIVKTKLGGICGTDVHLISLSVSSFLSIIGNPQNLFPMGHEVVGTVCRAGKKVKSFKEGDRVVFLPAPSCDILGFKQCPGCRSGNLQSCYVIAGVGDGSDREKLYGGSGKFGGFGGGGYCEYTSGLEKQFFKVPEGVADEAAVMTEPFSVALHPAARNLPSNSDSVIVIGAGPMKSYPAWKKKAFTKKSSRSQEVGSLNLSWANGVCTETPGLT